MLENFFGILVLPMVFVLGFWIMYENFLRGKFRNNRFGVFGGIASTAAGLAFVWYSWHVWHKSLIAGRLMPAIKDFFIMAFYFAAAALILYLAYNFIRHAFLKRA